MKKCEICGKEFENHSLYANHIRWYHKENDNTKLSEAAIINNENRYGKWVIENVKCAVCDGDVEIKYREGKKKEKYYCTRSCANKRVISDETKEKISTSILKRWENDDFRETTLNQFKSPRNKRTSSKGEREIRNKLKEIYGEEKVSSHRNIKIDNDLVKAVDIYIKEKNTIIEYDGIWHFKKVNEGHKFELQQLKDKLLNEYCLINSIKLIRIKEEIYLKNKEKTFLYIFDIIENKEIGNYIIYDINI